MPKIAVYEAEPGDWRFDPEHWGTYVEVTEEEYQELVTLSDYRRSLNERLKNLKIKEVDEWETL